MRIGALTTLAEIERNTELAERLPILAQAVRRRRHATAPRDGDGRRQPAATHPLLVFSRSLRLLAQGRRDVLHARNGENKYAAIFEQGPCVSSHPPTWLRR